VFLVSHDRRFLDNVVTSTIVFEGAGQWREYEGGVEDWIAQSMRVHGAAPVWGKRGEGAAATPASSPPQPVANPAVAKRKLSYKEQRELEALPQRIEALEAEQKAIAAELGDGLLYARHPERAAALAQRHATSEDELLQALERWEALGHTS